MTINYRSLDDTSAISDKILKQEALQADRDFFVKRCELKRLLAVKKEFAALTDEQVAGVEKQIEDIEKYLEWNADKASRKLRRAGIGESEQKQGRIEFLNSWILSIETEHATNVVLLEAREDDLDSSTDDEERAALELEIQTIEHNLEVIEIVHKVAAAELDALN